MKIKSALILLAASIALVHSQSADRFEFRMPHGLAYRVDDAQRLLAAGAAPEWIAAHIDGNSTNSVELGSRVVVQLRSADDLANLTAGHQLQLSRTIRSNIFILQAPD